MLQALRLHPDSICRAVRQIEVDIARPRPDRLALSYRVTGTMSDILMPPVAAATRSDGLWRHTCFEAFVRASSAPRYYEINLAPSTQWAAYRFNSYRSGMSVAREIEAPRIELQTEPQSSTLHAAFDVSRLPDLVGEVSWQVGLSAVVEDTSGISYWALAHPPGKPDFHHRDCFALEFFPAVSP
ncbi:MAG: DOMON-like domain-containing protein [Xanthobacteraceae bacterium]|nr:DOMON-like domain-containing protein [Xanthobacteraceae bacterium]